LKSPKQYKKYFSFSKNPRNPEINYETEDLALKAALCFRNLLITQGCITDTSSNNLENKG